MAWTNLKAAIAETITTNGNQEITGAVLQNTLNAIVNTIGENATFAGVATTTTNPGVPDGPVFYLAFQAGIYSNFNAVEVTSAEIAFLLWKNNTWSKLAFPYATTANAGLMSAEDKKKTLKTAYVNFTSVNYDVSDAIIQIRIPEKPAEYTLQAFTQAPRVLFYKWEGENRTSIELTSTNASLVEGSIYTWDLPEIYVKVDMSKSNKEFATATRINPLTGACFTHANHELQLSENRITEFIFDSYLSKSNNLASVIKAGCIGSNGKLLLEENGDSIPEDHTVAIVPIKNGQTLISNANYTQNAALYDNKFNYVKNTLIKNSDEIKYITGVKESSFAVFAFSGALSSYYKAQYVCEGTSLPSNVNANYAPPFNPIEEFLYSSTTGFIFVDSPSYQYNIAKCFKYINTEKYGRDVEITIQRVPLYDSNSYFLFYIWNRLDGVKVEQISADLSAGTFYNKIFWFKDENIEFVFDFNSLELAKAYGTTSKTKLQLKEVCLNKKDTNQEFLYDVSNGYIYVNSTKNLRDIANALRYIRFKKISYTKEITIQRVPVDKESATEYIAFYVWDRVSGENESKYYAYISKGYIYGDVLYYNDDFVEFVFDFSQLTRTVAFASTQKSSLSMKPAAYQSNEDRVIGVDKKFCSFGSSSTTYPWLSNAAKDLGFEFLSMGLGGASWKMTNSSYLAYNYKELGAGDTNVIMNQVATLFKKHKDEGYYPDVITFMSGLNDCYGSLSGTFEDVENADFSQYMKLLGWRNSSNTIKNIYTKNNDSSVYDANGVVKGAISSIDSVSLTCSIDGVTYNYTRNEYLDILDDDAPVRWFNESNPYKLSTTVNMRACIEFVSRKFPEAQIIIFTFQKVGSPSFNQTSVNTLYGITKKTAELFSFPIVDFYHSCGWSKNAGTISLYSDDLLHPNTAGNAMWKNFAVRQLSNIIAYRI